ncbi:2-dehydropantoate 2-reductase [Roseomonas hellenica]|uniref:2-dehydropantoate 2-reductase n=1 Tax=Plastoroseomonas hellenica TaxID=2687306 RepID=A0ABS5F0D9_9PROT|nr:2-dehydropantoate 2-reductase [Plastoroseomonas hellenica]MBR0666004.1 2-dehydropantoate 2-reductase [Plastoroseomonas hellenica]
MRILVVGAGAIGGYFGGRLLQAGRDVTFLLRPKRAALIAERGLVIKSPVGDATLKAPTVTADALAAPYDLILLSCKAYDLESALTDVAPAVGPESAVLPMLNGMRHLDILDARFGPARVLGGQCGIGTTLDADGAIRHLNPMATMGFGERDGSLSPRVNAFAEACAGTGFDAKASTTVLQDMWEKWVLLTSIAASTSAMRAPVGVITAAPGGEDFVLGLMEECISIATASGHAPRQAFLERLRSMLTAPGSKQTASMFRDILNGGRVEADHIVGDLIARAKAPVPRLRFAYTHLKAYEAQLTGL